MGAIEAAGGQVTGLLVDYHLDRGNGVAAIRDIRRRFGETIPAILITDDRSPHVRAAARGGEHRGAQQAGEAGVPARAARPVAHPTDGSRRSRTRRRLRRTSPIHGRADQPDQFRVVEGFGRRDSARRNHFVMAQACPNSNRRNARGGGRLNAERESSNARDNFGAALTPRKPSRYGIGCGFPCASSSPMMTA